MTLKLIRQFLGLSQQAFAEGLGMTRSHYSMLESGMRDLPAKKRLIIDAPALLLQIVSPVVRPNKELKQLKNHQQEECREYIGYELRRVDHKISRLSRQIEKFKNKQDSLDLLLAKLNQMRGSSIKFPATWLEVIINDTLAKRKEFNDLALLKLRLRKQQLESMAAFFKNELKPGN